MSEISERFHIPNTTLRNRYHMGVRGDDILQNHRRSSTCSIHGKYYTFRELAQKYHLCIPTIRHRYQLGLREDDLISPLKIHLVQWHGHFATLRKLNRYYMIDLNTLRQRYYRGDRGKALLRPVLHSHLKQQFERS